MIRCHFARLLGERKLKISDVARDTGINRGTLTRLYYETAERLERERGRRVTAGRLRKEAAVRL